MSRSIFRGVAISQCHRPATSAECPGKPFMPYVSPDIPADLDLSLLATAAPAGMDKSAARQASEAMATQLANLQELLYANRQHSLLVILQGLDTSGKDSSIKQVFREVNPMGLDIHSFKAPTTTELAQDFLWRSHHRVPSRGLIGIFNRSHYESAVTDRVMGFCDRATQMERCLSIREFERHLVANGTLVCKFFLHISRETQKERLLVRLQDPQKHWKLSLADLESRKHFDVYMNDWSRVITATHQSVAPWHVVQADQKWYRDFVMLSVLIEKLKGLNMGWPALTQPVTAGDITD
ncbi:MAG TPA: polyphosphate kinase [Moraxellaceae bacterium]|nr:polyphosphate kinase [Moraxellaceae bacterium]